YPPLHIGTGAMCSNDAVSVKGDVSSQFLTALLLAAPIHACDAQADVVIKVDGELISSPYVSITLNMMAQFGVSVDRDGWQRFTIAAGSQYQSPGQLHIEGDASSASYFMALGALGGGPVRIHG